MQQKKITSSAIIAAVLIAGIVFLVWKNTVVTPENDAQGITFTLDQQNVASSTPRLTDVADTKTYTNPTNHFSFNYPKDFTIADVPDDVGESIVVQNVTAHVGFQVYVRAFDEPLSAITPNRIEADIPNLKISNPQSVTVGQGVEGLAFISTDVSKVSQREVWFVRDGFLYQISSPIANEALLHDVLLTWKFGVK